MKSSSKGWKKASGRRYWLWQEQEFPCLVEFLTSGRPKQASTPTWRSMTCQTPNAYSPFNTSSKSPKLSTNLPRTLTWQSLSPHLPITSSRCWKRRGSCSWIWRRTLTILKSRQVSRWIRFSKRMERTGELAVVSASCRLMLRLASNLSETIRWWGARSATVPSSQTSFSSGRHCQPDSCNWWTRLHWKRLTVSSSWVLRWLCHRLTWSRIWLSRRSQEYYSI